MLIVGNCISLEEWQKIGFKENKKNYSTVGFGIIVIQSGKQTGEVVH